MRAKLLPCVLAVGLIAACTLDPVEEQPEYDFANCTRNTNCEPGFVCEVGVCVVNTPVKGRIDIQLTPPPGTDLVKEQFIGVEIEQGEPLPDLHFQTPLTLGGKVVRDQTSANQIRTRIIARRSSPTIEGFPLRFDTVAPDNVSADTLVNDLGYILRVPAGVYELAALPSDPGFPPTFVRELPIRDPLQSQTFVLEETELRQVSGTVLFVDVSLDEDGEDVFVEGAEVRAIDSSGQAASTTAVTDADGNFAVALRASVPEFRLVVDPSEANPDLPRIVTTVFTVQAGVGQISLGRINPIQRSISGRVLGTDGALVPNTTIQFIGEVGNGQWVYSVFSQDGTYADVRLTPGVYRVLVAPPTDSDSAVTEIDRVIVPARGNIPESLQRIVVPNRVLFTGQVFGTNRPLADAIVRFVQIRAGFDISQDVVGELRNVTVTSNFRGRYQALLDPGTYEISVEPTVLSGFAATRPYRTTVSLGQPVAVNLTAARPNVAYGYVFDDEGQAVTGATVEIFEHIAAVGGVRRVAVGRTNEQGRYRLLVPELIEPEQP